MLLALFVIFLVMFAGKTGVRAVLCFILTILTIWKVLVPFFLKGYNPIWIGIAFTLILSVMIIALVYGFDRRCASAVSGTFLGVLVTCLLGMLFTDLFKIHGAVMSSSESLLYAGYQDLNLTRIFMASIFIGASGALIDLSVDITSAVSEVVQKRPDIGWKEATGSGMNVGRAAMGTMTTTLLLAYSGGYIAMLMVFMAQGTPLINMINYKYVAAEDCPHHRRLDRPGGGCALYCTLFRLPADPKAEESAGEGQGRSGKGTGDPDRAGKIAFHFPFLYDRTAKAPAEIPPALLCCFLFFFVGPVQDAAQIADVGISQLG